MLFDLSTLSFKTLFANTSYPWDALKNLESYFKTKPLGIHQTPLPQGVFVENPQLVSIGTNCILEPGCYIKGPCIIGNHCQIRHGAYLREFVLTADHVVIGHGTEVKHSIFLTKAKAPHLSYIGDSILGNRVNFGAGVKCANVRLNKEEIKIFWNNEWLSTGLKKCGVLCGDDVQLGCNVVTNPGTIIGKQTICYPSLTLGGVISPQSIIKSSTVLPTTFKKE